ncbi:hypothetical protein [Paenibacillus aceti]|uniref:hypothetical protein n=1 Tax=Paenibacillus aceti TaxID=1820010 RepID=UPI001E45C788|nr:hypothetical protein [Paenibacillus aceti]
MVDKQLRRQAGHRHGTPPAEAGSLSPFCGGLAAGHHQNLGYPGARGIIVS